MNDLIWSILLAASALIFLRTATTFRDWSVAMHDADDDTGDDTLAFSLYLLSHVFVVFSAGSIVFAACSFWWWIWPIYSGL